MLDIVLSENTVQTMPYPTSSKYMNIIYKTLQSTTHRIASDTQPRKYRSHHTFHMSLCVVGRVYHKPTLLEEFHERLM